MSENLSFIPTKCSALKKEPESDFKTVVFNSYKSKANRSKEINEETDRSKPDTNIFNIKKARYEIVKFGISGLDADKKEEAKIQLAVKLGAKPPKNKYKNYKLLLEEKKKQKEDEANKAKFLQLGKNSLGKSLGKAKKFDKKMRKKKEDLLDIYGKVKIKK